MFVKESYIKSLFLCLCTSMVLSYAPENEVTKVATAAANWLKLETGTRAIGMSGAFTSIGSGVAGIPYNPANVAFIKNQEGFVSTTNYVADISYHVMGYGRNLSGIDFVALHIFYLDISYLLEIICAFIAEKFLKTNTIENIKKLQVI